MPLSKYRGLPDLPGDLGCLPLHLSIAIVNVNDYMKFKLLLYMFAELPWNCPHKKKIKRYIIPHQNTFWYTLIIAFNMEFNIFTTTAGYPLKKRLQKRFTIVLM